MFFSELTDVLKDREHVYIVGHVNPDGDCIGSTLSLAMLLQKREIRTKILLKDVPNTYSFLPVEKWVIDREPDKIDALISLDCGDTKRLGDFKELVDKAEIVINIDHHISNTLFGNINHVDISASSTSEIVFDMIDDEELIDENIAMCLYTGIIYDTGVFKHSNTTERTHNIAGKLIGYGFDFTEIINKLFYYKSLIGLKVQSKAIENIQMISEGKIALTYLTNNEIQALNATKKETESIVQILNEIENVECAVFIYETSLDEYKVSLRSKGLIDVCEIAKKFGGGGHAKASGCSLEGHLSTVIQKIISEVNGQLNTGVN